jgi:hypothetical protein
VRGRWAVEACGQVDRSGILRGDPGCEESEDHEDDNQHDADGCQGIVASIDSNPAAERDGGSRHRCNYHIISKITADRDDQAGSDGAVGHVQTLLSFADKRVLIGKCMDRTPGSALRAGTLHPQPIF